MSDAQPTDEEQILVLIDPAASEEEYAAIIAVLRARRSHAKPALSHTSNLPSRWQQAARREGLRNEMSWSRFGWMQSTRLKD